MLCPSRHRLTPSVSVNHSCDVCKRSLLAGTSLLSCRGCNYDVCPSCVRPKVCLAGHQLAPFVAVNHRCDVCRQSCVAGSTLMSCRTCDYDVCATCAGSPSAPGAATRSGEAKAAPPASRSSVCLSGHQLTPFTSVNHRCDVCRVSCPAGSSLMSCRACDYDVCATCGRNAQGSNIAKNLIFWEWTDDRTKWTVYSHADAVRIEAHCSAQKNAPNLPPAELGDMSWNKPGDPTRYKFDLRAMTQTNLTTKQTRHIRRRRVAACSQDHEMTLQSGIVQCSQCKQKVEDGYYYCAPCRIAKCLYCQAEKLTRSPEVKRILSACLSGHRLAPFVSVIHRCDVCKQSCPAGSPLMSCRACDYDVCAACVGNPPEPAPAPYIPPTVPYPTGGASFKLEYNNRVLPFRSTIAVRQVYDSYGIPRTTAIGFSSSRLQAIQMSDYGSDLLSKFGYNDGEQVFVIALP